jgi:hypothetical protein
MYDALLTEQDIRMLNSAQESVRMILSEYFRSKFTKGVERPIIEKEARNCDDEIDFDERSLFQPFISIAESLGESADMFGVEKLFIKIWGKIGAVFDLGDIYHFKGDERRNLVVFLEDNDPFHDRMRMAIGSLERLIREDGIRALQPHFDSVVDIILTYATK